MRAASNTSYGAPNVLTLTEQPRPTLGTHEVLVEVHASPVTQGDRRMRAADFPGISWLLGRLVFGLIRPRNPIPGTMFAGRIVEIGAAVTRYTVGERVFGGCPQGAQAELLAVPEDGAMAQMPAGLDYAEAAAIPYGAVTALVFLRDLGKLERGQKVLIIGASGGVGRFAVQLARHMGAEVTGVCSRDQDLVRELGADHVIDYKSEDFAANGQRYDLIFDTSQRSSFSRCRASLTSEGRYLTLHMSVRVLLEMAATAITGGRRAIFGLAMGDREQTETVRELVEAGALRPVIAHRVPLARIAEAHALVEEGRTRGEVIIDVADARALDDQVRPRLVA